MINLTNSCRSIPFQPPQPPQERKPAVPTDYTPILIFFLIISLITAVILILPHYLGPRRPDKAKSEISEPDKPAYGHAQRRATIKYYRVALLFSLFSIQVLFLYPWAVLFWNLKWYGLLQIGIFTLLLVVNYLYARQKGLLEWE